MAAVATPLLDHALAAWDFEERHSTRIAAPRERVWESLLSLDFANSALVRLLFRLRSFGRAPRTGGLPTSLAAMMRSPFVELAREVPRELVLGIAGRFWAPAGDLAHFRNAGEFVHYAVPGTARAAWGFALGEEAEGKTTLVTVTRIHCIDAAALRRFRLYWSFVRPGSGLIRLAALAAIKRNAERAPSGAGRG